MCTPNEALQIISQKAHEAINSDGKVFLSEFEVFATAYGALEQGAGTERERAALLRIVAHVRPATQGEAVFSEVNIALAADEGLRTPNVFNAILKNKGDNRQSSPALCQFDPVDLIQYVSNAQELMVNMPDVWSISLTGVEFPVIFLDEKGEEVKLDDNTMSATCLEVLDNGSCRLIYGNLHTDYFYPTPSGKDEREILKPRNKDEENELPF